MALHQNKTCPVEPILGEQKYEIFGLNTASDRGYTTLHDDLRKLNKQYADKPVVSGFLAKDFKEQEKGADADTAQFVK